MKTTLKEYTIGSINNLKVGNLIEFNLIYNSKDVMFGIVMSTNINPSLNTIEILCEKGLMSVIEHSIECIVLQ